MEQDWSNEKEQFSPVSILDCPFEDEEEMKSNYMINSFFEEHKHMQKTRNFENISSMETLIKCLELEDEPHNHSTKQCSEFAPVIGNNNEEEAHDLFNFVKRSIQSNDLMINAENLLFDYIEQSIEENNVNVNVNCSKKLNFCKVVEDWIQGQHQELYLGWEVKDGRHVYISDM